MQRSLIGVGLGFLLLATVVLAQDQIQSGKIKKVDPDKGTITIAAPGAKDRTFLVTDETRLMGPGGQLTDRLRNKNLKEGAFVRFKAEKKDGKKVLWGLMLLGDKVPPQQKPFVKFDSSRLKPLTEMGMEEYHGFKGGLYPDGRNERPAAHEAAGLALAKKVQPLDADGKPSPSGKIVLLTVGMSNTSQVSTGFIRLANAAGQRNPKVVIVNGAQGGQTAAVTQSTQGRGEKYWSVVDQRLEEAGLTRAQVQAAWIKQADARPDQGFPKYARTLQDELKGTVRVLAKRFPNCKLVYLSSRTSGVYAKTPLNPEPYAFESGFSVKWLIEQQLKGDPELNYDPAKGAVVAPWLSWGPYLWVNGASKRADGFFVLESDYVGDGTHHSQEGMAKHGRLLLEFFRNDTTTRGWFKD
jgi:hypothetical protein